MAVSFVAGAQSNNGQTSATLTATFTIPASAQAGDTALLVVTQNTGANTFTPPSGWTTLRSGDFAATSLEGALFGKDLAAGEPGSSISVTASATSRFPGVLLVFRGTQLSSVTVTAATSTTSSTTLTSPSITTTVDNSFIVNFWISRTSNAAPAGTITVPANHTADTASTTAFTTSPNDIVQTSHLTTPGLAGSYGGQNATASLAASHAVIYTIAVPPVATSFSGTVTLSGSGTVAGAGQPSISGSRTNTGASTLAGNGTPAITGSLSLGGSGSLVTAGGAPIAGVLASTGDGQLSLAGLAVRYVFSPPYVQRYVPVIPPVNALMNFGLAVLRIDGQWVETEYPTEQQLDAADLYFPGGHDNPVDIPTATLLTAAGYTVTQIQEN